MLPVKVSKTTVPDRVYNGHLVVGLTRVQITEVKGNLTTGLIIRAPGGTDPVPNTATIWVGGSNVTADSDPTTGGFPLGPGASIVINVESADDLYFISTSADQDLAWIGV